MQQMKRCVALIFLVAACAGEHSSTLPDDADAGTGVEDAGEVLDAGKIDAGTEPADAGAEPADAGAEPADAGAEPLEGEGPLSRVFVAPVDVYNELGTYRESPVVQVQAYFPEGVREDAPVFLSRLRAPLESPDDGPVFEGKFNHELRVSPILEVFQYGRLDRLTDAVLDASLGVLTGLYSSCPHCSYDTVGERLKGDAVLRNSGQEAPTGTLHPSGAIVPISTLTLVSSAPLALPVTGSVVVQAGAHQIEGTLSATRSVLTWRPSTSQVLPPNETISITGSGLADVLGREVSLSLQLQPVKTTDTIVDLSLATKPPEGALNGLSWYESEHRLVPSIDPLGRSFCGLASLGRPAGTTKLTVRVVQKDCAANPLARVALVTREGSSIAVPVSCDVTGAPALLTLPGDGDVWLVVDGVYPGRPLDLSVDSLAFE